MKMVKYLTIKQVADKRLIPWAQSRPTVSRLFHENRIKHHVVKYGHGKHQRTYLTTPEWVNDYLKRELKTK